MCGIVGYVGSREARPLLFAGLQKLEYRGYDSAGISVLNGDCDRCRAGGRQPVALRAAIDAREARSSRRRRGGCARRAPQPATGIGHTRWATHGRVTEQNAHPHFDTDRPRSTSSSTGSSRTTSSSSAACRRPVHVFTSETDAEVIAHLIAHHYDGDLVAAVRAAYAELRGHYAFVAMSADEPGLLVGARNECPLIIGRGEGEQFIASAIPAFLSETRRVQYIGDDEIVVLAPDGVEFQTRRRGAARRGRSSRSTGTRRWPRSRATRRSCSRRSTSRPTPSPRRSASGRRAPRHRSRRPGRDRRRVAAQHPARRDRRLRNLVPRWADRPLRDRGVGPPAGRGRRRLGVPLPQPGRRSGRPRDRDHAVRRDGRHARGDAYCPRRAAPRCWRSRTSWARRRPGKPTACCTPAPAWRSASPPRRRSSARCR